MRPLSILATGFHFPFQQPPRMQDGSEISSDGPDDVTPSISKSSTATTPYHRVYTPASSSLPNLDQEQWLNKRPSLHLCKTADLGQRARQPRQMEGNNISTINLVAAEDSNSKKIKRFR
jgi:hypothetical protein